jgi:succinylglutamate desuccinylase
MSDYIIENDDVVGVYAKQIAKLDDTNKELRERIRTLEQEIESRDQLPIPKSIVKQIVQMEALIRKLQEDIIYYKRFVPKQVIINKEGKEQPTRRGGIPKK